MPEVRSFSTAGLRLSLEGADPEVARWPTPALARPEPGGEVCGELVVRVRRLAPTDAPRVRGAGLTTRFAGRQIVLTDASGGRLRQRLRADAALERADLEWVPDAALHRSGPRLDAIAFCHRLVRAGAVPFEACVAIRDDQALLFVGVGPSLREAWSRQLAGAGGTVLHGPVALRAGPSGVRVHPTPWVRLVRGAPVRHARVHAVHVVRPAREVVAEPLVGRAAVEGLAPVAALREEDGEGRALLRAALGLLLPGLRVVRMGSPSDARVRAYAFGRSSVRRPLPQAARPAGG